MINSVSTKSFICATCGVERFYAEVDGPCYQCGINVCCGLDGCLPLCECDVTGARPFTFAAIRPTLPVDFMSDDEMREMIMEHDTAVSRVRTMFGM